MTKQLIILAFLLGTGIFSFLPQSQAAGDDPLSDIITLLQQMDKYESELPNMKNLSQAQLTELQNQWAALSKAYGMSDTRAEQNARLWSANDWNSVLAQASGGNNARFQQLMQSYAKMYPNLQNGNSINPRTLEKTSYTQRGETYNAALSASAYTYDEINNHIKNLETILQQVDDANKNQNEKAAIDLNSRLVAELAFIQIEMLKLQSIHTQMVATKDQSEFNNETIDKQFMNISP